MSSFTLHAVNTSIQYCLDLAETYLQDNPFLLNRINFESAIQENDGEIKELEEPDLGQLASFSSSIPSVPMSFKADFLPLIQGATKIAMQEMLLPSVSAYFVPLFVGIFFGIPNLLMYTLGIMVCGIHISVSMSNTGSSWSSAKRAIASSPEGKMSEIYKATIIGDTIGDPLKVGLYSSLSNFLLLFLIIRTQLVHQ